MGIASFVTVLRDEISRRVASLQQVAGESGIIAARSRTERVNLKGDPMRPLLTTLSVLSISFLVALPAQAQELNVTANDTVQTVLAARKGKPVTVRLSGGQELTGTVRETTGKLVVLGGLSGREFFDAVVPLEKIEAVLVRNK
jgi:hypothetical protein